LPGCLSGTSAVTLDELVGQVTAFDNWGSTDQIRFIAWFFHSHDDRADFEVGDFRRAYQDLSMTVPPGLSQLVKQLVAKGDFDKKAARMFLVRRLRSDFDNKYGLRQTAISVAKLLRELPAKVPGVAERAFLDAVIKCFEVGAYRAAIVMSWMLAYDHLLNWVFRNRIDDFNKQWPLTFTQGKQLVVKKREDFADAKSEFLVLQNCRMAGIITEDVRKMLEETLNKRNSAAHPSDIIFGQTETEGYVEHLVQNVVLKLL